MTRLYALLGILAALAAFWFLRGDQAVQTHKAAVAENALKTTQVAIDHRVKADAQTATKNRAIVTVARRSTDSARKVLNETKSKVVSDCPADGPEFDRVFNDALSASRSAVASARSVSR